MLITIIIINNYNNNNGNSNIADDSANTFNNNNCNTSTSIPKELLSTLPEGLYWIFNDRPSYATIAARNNNSNNESNTSTVATIITSRKTAIHQTLGLISGPYNQTIFNIRDKV